MDASGLSADESINTFLALGEKLYHDDRDIRESIIDLTSQIRKALKSGNFRDVEVKLVMGPNINDQIAHCDKIRNLMEHSGIHIRNWRPVFGGARMCLSLGKSAPLDKIVKDIEDIASEVGGDVPGVQELLSKLKDNRFNPKSRNVCATIWPSEYEPNKDKLDQFSAIASKRGYRVSVNTINAKGTDLRIMTVDFSAQVPDTTRNI